MKKTLSFILFIFICFVAWSQFKAGESVNINSTHKGDLYAAGGTVSVTKPVIGDLVVSGGELVISDSIYQDLLIAGGEISILGPVLDDIRAAGGTVNITSSVGGDVMVFGGEVSIARNVSIGGNLVVFGGEVATYARISGGVFAYGGEIDLLGEIEKDVSIKGGEILIDAMVNGSVKASAEQLRLGPSAKIKGDLSYWTAKGEQTLDPQVVDGRVTFDSGLAIQDSGSSLWMVGSMAFGLIILYVMSGVLLLVVLQLLFGRQLADISSGLMDDIAEHLGMGALYLFGVPALILVLFVLIFGIPLALFVLILYVFSLFFAYPIASLLAVNYVNTKRTEKWSSILIILLALVVLIAVRLLTFIPILGWLVGLVVIIWTYGAVIKFYRSGKGLS